MRYAIKIIHNPPKKFDDGIVEVCRINVFDKVNKLLRSSRGFEHKADAYIFAEGI